MITILTRKMVKISCNISIPSLESFVIDSLDFFFQFNIELVIFGFFAIYVLNSPNFLFGQNSLTASDDINCLYRMLILKN